MKTVHLSYNNFNIWFDETNVDRQIDGMYGFEYADSKFGLRHISDRTFEIIDEKKFAIFLLRN